MLIVAFWEIRDSIPVYITGQWSEEGGGDGGFIGHSVLLIGAQGFIEDTK